jgi:hypothetical protein
MPKLPAETPANGLPEKHKQVCAKLYKAEAEIEKLRDVLRTGNLRYENEYLLGVIREAADRENGYLAEIERLQCLEQKYYEAIGDYQNAAKVLKREGFYKCTAAACNCHSWHKGEDDG